MQLVAPHPARGRSRSTRSSRDPDSTLPLALLLVFPTIGVEQLLHTSTQALFALPLYEGLHWLSDSLLALPLALLAVWGGQRLASRVGLGVARLSDLVARAILIAVLFALTLVPGSALHDVADRLTHVHATLSIHNHAPLAVPVPTEPTVADSAATLVNFVVHGLGDGFAGQAVALPLMVLAMWEVRKQHARRPPVAKPREG